MRVFVAPRLDLRPLPFARSHFRPQGTTWMQQIVAMLIFNGEDPPKPVPDISPWVDLAAGDLDAKMEMIDQLQHRRFLKTHLPATAMPYYPKAKYIYIGRDGRDAYMSLCHHYDKGNDSWYASMNDRPTLIGPPLPKWHEEKFTPATLFDRWISQGWETHPWESDGWPWWSLFYNVSTWWQYRNLENILFVHFNNLKADLPGEMRRIAEFLGTPVDDAKFDEQVRKCTFEYMQGMGDKVAPLGGRPWAADGKADGGGQIFVNKGTNNRWKDVLSKEQLEKYDRVVRDQLTPECATWLSTGEYPDIVVSK